MTEACYLFWAVTRRGTANFSWKNLLERELEYLPPVIFMIFLVLIIAATFEVLEIHVGGDFELLFWIPFVVCVLLLVGSES